MFETNQDIKRFYYIVETLKIHGEIMYGTDDIDVDALMNFLKNPNTKLRCWGTHDLESIEEVVLNDILEGMPVWRFFHLPEWTQNLLEKEWEEICAEDAKKQAIKAEQDKKKYLCLQDCIHYDCHDSPMGRFIKCHATGLGGDSFKYRKKCAKYCDKKSMTEQELRDTRIGLGMRKRK